MNLANVTPCKLQTGISPSRIFGRAEFFPALKYLESYNKEFVLTQDFFQLGYNHFISGEYTKKICRIINQSRTRGSVSSFTSHLVGIQPL